MILYRDAGRCLSTRAELDRLARVAARADTATYLIGVGELEQGIADAIHDTADDWTETDERLRAAAIAAAHAFLAASEGRPVELRTVLPTLEAVARLSLPPCVRIRPPEGFVHYALDPAAYAAAARSYRRDVGAREAAAAIVVGIRSIGTTLSAVVAAALGARRSLTVRPRGTTGERRVTARPGLEALLAQWLADGGDVLVVDEGPGATGETFAAVAAWLRAIGTADPRIVLFPSGGHGMPLAPEDRRRWFEAARKYPPPVGDDRPARVAASFGLAPPTDLSAGRWRERLPGAAGHPAIVAHERVKCLAPAADGGSVLIRFAGLGRWGESVVERAERLAAAGIGPRVVGFADGFLLRRWVDGAPLRPGRAPPSEAIATYLAARAPLFRTGTAADPAPIREMLRANAVEALGEGVAGLDAALRRLDRLPAREAVIPDARLASREWVRRGATVAKVDALDHGDGLRLPGPVDGAWDLAGAAVEFGLPPGVVAAIAWRIAIRTGEDDDELIAAVAAYRAPYAAFHLADSVIAAREAGTEVDRLRLEAEGRRYRRLLARELAAAAGAPGGGRAAA